MTFGRLLALAGLLLLVADEAAAQAVSGQPQVVTVRPLRVAAVMALIPAVLLWVLARYRRQEYVHAWVAMWLSLASALFVFTGRADAINLETPEWHDAWVGWERAALAMAGLTWLGGMALLPISATWVRGPAQWPRQIWPLTAAGTIAAVGSAVLFGLGVVAAVLWVAGLVCFVTGAYRFFSLARRERFVGALLIGVALTTVPVHTGLAQLMMLFDLTVPDRFEVWIMVYALLALGMHLLIFEDITYELRHQNAALSHAQAALKAKAMTDPLTGCYNRRFFDEVSAHELDRHRRYGLPLSLLFVDCDRFKSINDAGGHETGDRVLDLMAALLREHVRQSDYVFRWGGDEFLVMIACDEASAADKAKQIQQAFSKHPLVLKLPEGVALSVGLVTVPHDATDLLDYVGDADRRMYEEKTRHATGH